MQVHWRNLLRFRPLGAGGEAVEGEEGGGEGRGEWWVTTGPRIGGGEEGLVFAGTLNRCPVAFKVRARWPWLLLHVLDFVSTPHLCAARLCSAQEWWGVLDVWVGVLGEGSSRTA
jgi:hypothetical protein